jgi:glyoxylase-like metal-dependent hydrolase (beta-lactamase superfamily II)
MQSWRIGDVTVTKIVELEAVGGSKFLLPQATKEVCQGFRWMFPHFMDEEGRLKMSVHALVVQTPTKRIIVDTCLGNDKQGRGVPGWNNLQGPFLRDLAAAGFPRESIDIVMCTHLHVDHVGWNTMLVDGKWVPTFPNARYLMARTEFEYWQSRREKPEEVAIFEDSVRPVFEAGLVDLVDTDHRICDEVKLVPTVGHTPGHCSVAITSGGRDALITGDFVHHPCQMAMPAWAATVDYDSEQSTRTRKEVFGRLADTSTLVIGTHFAGPTAGHLKKDGDAFRLEV